MPESIQPDVLPIGSVIMVEPENKREQIFLVLDLSCVPEMDFSAAQRLTSLKKQYFTAGIKMVFAGGERTY